ANTTGANNVGLGGLALRNNTSGSQNVAIGGGDGFTVDGALYSNTSGVGNVAVGYQALQQNQTGSYNTAIGAGSGAQFGNSAYGNTLLGADPDQVTTVLGSNNIAIGYGVIFPTAGSTGSNQLNIGNLIFGTLPATSTALRNSTTGKFAIGSSSPYAKFSIQTNNGDTATTLFAIGSSTASATSTLFSISNIGSTTLANVPSSVLYTDANSTIVGAPITTNGFVLALSNGVPTWVATSSISGGVTSIQQSFGTTQNGAITLATTTS